MEESLEDFLVRDLDDFEDFFDLEEPGEGDFLEDDDDMMAVDGVAVNDVIGPYYSNK